MSKLCPHPSPSAHFFPARSNYPLHPSLRSADCGVWAAGGTGTAMTPAISGSPARPMPLMATRALRSLCYKQEPQTSRRHLIARASRFLALTRCTKAKMQGRQEAWQLELAESSGPKPSPNPDSPSRGNWPQPGILGPTNRKRTTLTFHVRHVPPQSV